MMLLRGDQLLLCRIQGELFEHSAKDGYDSERFISFFMNSNTAWHMDQLFDHLQWAGEAYIYGTLIDEAENNELTKGKTYETDSLFWIGFLYRYWHYYKDCTSKDMYKIADAQRMNLSYPGYHTLSNELAIERLIEDYNNP